MKSTRRGEALRTLLGMCDDLQRARSKLAEADLGRDARGRLRRRVRAKSQRLERELTNYRFKGPLGYLMREYGLEPVHFQLLATLLQRHLRSDTPSLEGRLILASVFEDSFDLLAGMALLQENSVLRASGLIELDGEQENTVDVLEARFRISEAALEAFRDEIAGLVVDDRSSAQIGYASNHEFLTDLRMLQNLYKHRSERLFHQERWDRIHAGNAAPGRGLTRRIEAHWRRIEHRIAATPEAMSLPAVRFMHEFRLTEEERVIVVHLLFKELFEGNAYADAAELIRLVSSDEIELVRNRRLLLPTGALIRHEMIRIEAMIEGREMTGEVYLTDWVVNWVIGTATRDGAIGSDDRLDWHLYLEKLGGDSRSFFRDLEKN